MDDDIPQAIFHGELLPWFRSTEGLSLEIVLLTSNPRLLPPAICSCGSSGPPVPTPLGVRKKTLAGQSPRQWHPIHHLGATKHELLHFLTAPIAPAVAVAPLPLETQESKVWFTSRRLVKDVYCRRACVFVAAAALRDGPGPGWQSGEGAPAAPAPVPPPPPFPQSVRRQLPQWAKPRRNRPRAKAFWCG